MDHELKAHLPFFYDRTPLAAGVDRQLAETLLGIEVCMDSPDEECETLPSARLQPLGRVSACEARGDHVLATITLNGEAMGVDRLVECLDRRELKFGLWGVARTEGNIITAVRPTSVRIGRLRESAARGGLGDSVS